MAPFANELHGQGRQNALMFAFRLLLITSTITPLAHGQNDNFSNRSSIPSGSSTVYSNTIGATAELGEPDHAPGHPASASVWWQWTASQDGFYEVNTQGSSFDTILSVYVGGTLPGLENRGHNNDTYTLGQQSRVIFYAEAGETYLFAVDGENSSTGDVTLNLQPAVLRNDEFGQRIHVAGTKVLDVQSNVGATVSLFEPNHIPSLNSSSSIWWEWACDTNGWVTVDTVGSSFDTVAAVYVHDVILIGNNNDYYSDGDGYIELHPFDISDEFNARLRFYAVAGNRYQIVVDGSDGLENGSVILSIEQSQDHPANDNVSSAHPLDSEEVGDSSSASYFGSSIGASVELGEPDHNPTDETSASASVWFEWAAPALDRLVTIDTFDSDFDTILAVYSREGTNLIRWASNDDHDDAPDFQSSVTFNAKADTTYLITVDGYSGEQGDVGINLIATSQKNDSFHEAVTQFGLNWQSTSNNSQASAEPGEPAHAEGAPASRSIWWRWVSTIDGDVSIDTLGSNFDTVVAVYKGTLGDELNPLNQVASNDDAPDATNGQSSVSFPVEFGQVYHIAVDGNAGSTGDILLRFNALGGYDHWVTRFPALEALLLLPQDDPRRVGALPDGDPDADGFPNRLEAAFGLNPELNSQPSGNDPNKGNAPSYRHDGSNVIVEFTLDPLFAQANNNDDSLRFSVVVERSSNGIIWSSLTSRPVGGNRHRVTYPLAFGSNFGLFKVTAKDSQIVE